MSGENIDIFVLENVDGELFQRYVPAKIIDEFLEEINKEEEKEKTEKKGGGDFSI